jgi:hypothetical protein
VLVDVEVDVEFEVVAVAGIEIVDVAVWHG